MSYILLSSYTKYFSGTGNSLNQMANKTETVLNSFFYIARMIGLFGLVIGILMVAISFAVGNPVQRNEGKRRLGSLLFWGLVIIAFSSLASVFAKVVNSFA